jgi:hypothetical protein
MLIVRRRNFITLLGGAAAWPLAARAQQSERMRRIGVLMPFAENDSEAQANLTAFRQAFQMLGWTTAVTSASTIAGVVVVPENSIRPGWRGEAESAHHPM